jgi:hypothetical protein
MENLIFENAIIEAINNLPKDNISIETIIEYIDFNKKINVTKDEIIDLIKKVKYEKLNYKNRLDLINILLNDFYDNQIKKQFKSEEQEFNENKIIRNIIKEIIIAVYNDRNISKKEQKIIIKNSLLLLSENTGCVEDTKIAEYILDH